jgi:hypothetical protein
MVNIFISADMQQDKVKYFTNRDLIYYLLASFVLGLSIGYAFGRKG